MTKYDAITATPTTADRCFNLVARFGPAIAVASLVGAVLGLMAAIPPAPRPTSTATLFVDPGPPVAASTQASLPINDPALLAREAALLQAHAARRNAGSDFAVDVDDRRFALHVRQRAPSVTESLRRLDIVVSDFLSERQAARTAAAEPARAKLGHSLEGLRADMREAERQLTAARLMDAGPIRDDIVRRREEAFERARIALQDGVIDAMTHAEPASPTAPRVTLVAPVTLAPWPRPSLLPLAALGLAVGFALGLAGALVAASRDKGIRSADELAASSAASEVAVIPEIAPLPGLVPDGHRRTTLASARARFAPPDGDHAQAYRQAVLRLAARMRRLQKPGRPNVVMLAAPRAASGTSTLVIGLAAAAGAAGERALVVDAVARGPGLSMAFTDAGAAPADVAGLDRDALAGSIVSDAASGIAILPLAALRHGGAPLIGANLGTRRAIAAAVASLAQDYDLVLIDAGGLLDDERAAGLAHVADQIWITARYGDATAGEVRELCRLLPDGPRALGAVLNGHPASL